MISPEIPYPKKIVSKLAQYDTFDIFPYYKLSQKFVIKVMGTLEDDNSFSLPKKRNIFSSRFQYSERTIHSTEGNFTSAESSWSQLFGAKRTRAWQCQVGATPACRKKQISFFGVMKMEDAQYRDLPLCRSFISHDFFHFSSFIHNGDNLNLLKNLNFPSSFLMGESNQNKQCQQISRFCLISFF